MKRRRKGDREAIRAGKKRDYNSCRICGSTEKVEGHHVIDYSFGGASHPDNIVSLCHKHHRAVHDGKIDIDIF